MSNTFLDRANVLCLYPSEARYNFSRLVYPGRKGSLIYLPIITNKYRLNGHEQKPLYRINVKWKE